MLPENKISIDTVVEYLKEGDEDALVFLYDRYWDELMLSCSKVVKDTDECQDIIQEVFLIIWEKRSLIQIKTNIGAYLHGVLRYKIFRYLKTNYRKNTSTDHLYNILENKEKTHETPQSLMEHKEIYSSVLQIVSSLPTRCKEVYQLRQDDLSYDDIAKKLNISVKTVENQLLKAKKQLKLNLRHIFFVIVTFCAFAT